MPYKRISKEKITAYVISEALICGAIIKVDNITEVIYTQEATDRHDKYERRSLSDINDWAPGTIQHYPSRIEGLPNTYDYFYTREDALEALEEKRKELIKDLYACAVHLQNMDFSELIDIEEQEKRWKDRRFGYKHVHGCYPPDMHVNENELRIHAANV